MKLFKGTSAPIPQLKKPHNVFFFPKYPYFDRRFKNDSQKLNSRMSGLKFHPPTKLKQLNRTLTSRVFLYLKRGRKRYFCSLRIGHRYLPLSYHISCNPVLYATMQYSTFRPSPPRLVQLKPPPLPR